MCRVTHKNSSKIIETMMRVMMCPKVGHSCSRGELAAVSINTEADGRRPARKVGALVLDGCDQILLASLVGSPTSNCN